MACTIQAKKLRQCRNLVLNLPEFGLGCLFDIVNTQPPLGLEPVPGLALFNSIGRQKMLPNCLTLAKLLANTGKAFGKH